MAELKTAEGRPVRDASPARGAAHGPTTPKPTPLPLSTSQTSLSACTSSQALCPIWAGVEAAEEAAGGSRCRRSASTRVLRCSEQPGRAAVAGSTRARAQALRPAGPSEAGPRPAMQPLNSLREAQGGTQVVACEGVQNPAPRW